MSVENNPSENVDIIHLQNAHVTKYTGDKGESKWKVRKNKTNEDLIELSSEYTEGEIFEILDFARKFELTAFNEGINYGKLLNKEYYDRIFLQQESVLQQLRDENERLSDKLIKLISREE